MLTRLLKNDTFHLKEIMSEIVEVASSLADAVDTVVEEKPQNRKAIADALKDEGLKKNNNNINTILESLFYFIQSLLHVSQAMPSLRTVNMVSLQKSIQKRLNSFLMLYTTLIEHKPSLNSNHMD